MIFSDLRKTRTLVPLLLIAAVSATISSCARRSTDGEGESATFNVAEPLTLEKSQIVNASGIWSFPETNSPTFKACLLDIANGNPVPEGLKFAVDGESGTQELLTNNAGCITWTETIRFEFSRRETYVELIRPIRALGPHRGKRELRIAFNPWAKDGMVDLRQTEVAQLARGSSVASALSSASIRNEVPTKLDIERILIESNDDRYEQEANTLKLRLTFSPRLFRKGLAGNDVAEAVTRGGFRMSVDLIERRPGNGSDQLLILASKTFEKHTDNGVITLDAPLELQRMPKRTALLEMVYRLEPLSPPFEMTSDEGTIQLSSLKGGGFLTVRRNQPALQYLTQARADTARMMLESTARDSEPKDAICPDGSQELGFYLDRVMADNAGVEERTLNEQVPSKVRTNFMVCMNNSINRQPISDQSFEIRWKGETDGKRTTPPSDVNGCVRWSESISLDYFEREGWKSKTLVVTGTEAPFQVSREFPIHINPWQRGEEHFWNCRRGKEPTFRTERARLEMLDFSYTYLGRDHEIDSGMNLTLHRRYQIQMTPMYRRSSGYGGQPTYESVNDSRFRMKLLLLSPNQDESFSKIEGADAKTILSNFKYISSTERNVQARNGRLIEEVSLPVEFADLPNLATRSLVLIQLLPMESSSSLVSVPYYASFEAASAYGMMGLVANTARGPDVSAEKMHQIQADLAGLIDLGKSGKAKRKAPGSVASFGSEMKLRQPTPSELSKAGFTPQIIKTTLKGDWVSSANAKRLCILLGDKAPELPKKGAKAAPTPACLTNPHAHLVMAKSMHVETLQGRPDVMDSTYKNFSVNASVSVHRDSSESTADGSNVSDSVNVSTTAGVGFNFFGFAKVGADTGWSKGKDWFKSTSVSESKGAGGTGGASFSRSFGVEEIRFSLDGSMRECLSFRRKDQSQGMILCDPDTTRSREITESYFLISEIPSEPASALRDTKSVKDRPWIRAIRGKTAFESMRQLLENSSRKIVLTKDRMDIGSIDQLDNVLNSFAESTPKFSDGAFPSMIY